MGLEVVGGPLDTHYISYYYTLLYCTLYGMASLGIVWYGKYHLLITLCVHMMVTPQSAPQQAHPRWRRCGCTSVASLAKCDILTDGLTD